MKYGKDYEYPIWAQIVGFCLSCSSMLWIPGYAIYYLMTSPGSLKQVKLGCLTNWYSDTMEIKLSEIRANATIAWGLLRFQPVQRSIPLNLFSCCFKRFSAATLTRKYIKKMFQNLIQGLKPKFKSRANPNRTAISMCNSSVGLVNNSSFVVN